MKIKNIIFDIGNVLVRWAPDEAIKKVLPSRNTEEVLEQAKPLFKQLSLGQIEQDEAIEKFIEVLCITKEKSAELMLELVHHQKHIAGSIKIITKLNELGFNLYAVTDNTKAFVEYYRIHSDKYVFIKYFIDIANSAELGTLKPDPKMYNYILKGHNLNLSETIYIDDIKENVDGAVALGVNALRFIDPETLESDLLGFSIDLS